MEVIARKKRGAGALYLIGIFTVLFVSVMGPITRSGELVEWIIFGVVFCGLFAYAYVDYALVPNDVIMLDENNNLHLPKGVIIAISDVTDVSSKSMSYRRRLPNLGGTVTIKTENAKYTYNYIAGYAGVEIRLTDMMYRAKNGDGELQ